MYVFVVVGASRPRKWPENLAETQWSYHTGWQAEDLTAVIIVYPTRPVEYTLPQGLPQGFRAHVGCDDKLPGSAISLLSPQLLSWIACFLSRNQCPENRCKGQELHSTGARMTSVALDPGIEAHQDHSLC